MKNVLSVILCVLLVSSVTMGEIGNYTNDAGDGDWFNAGNWNYTHGLSPQLGDQAWVNLPGKDPLVLSGGDAEVEKLVLHDNNVLTIATGSTLGVLAPAGQDSTTGYGLIHIGNIAGQHDVINVDGTLTTNLLGLTIAAGSTSTVNVGPGGVINQTDPAGWIISGYGGVGNLNVTGGTINTVSHIYTSLAGHGNVNFTDSDINVGSGFLVSHAGGGEADIAMTNSTVSANILMFGPDGAGSTVVLNDSVISAAGTFDWNSTNSITLNGNSSIQLAAGIKTLDGVLVWTLADLEWVVFNSGGWAFEGEGLIKEYADGHFSIANVPEPATLSLLGLGAMTLLRRKKD